MDEPSTGDSSTRFGLCGMCVGGGAGDGGGGGLGGGKVGGSGGVGGRSGGGGVGGGGEGEGGGCGGHGKISTVGLHWNSKSNTHHQRRSVGPYQQFRPPGQCCTWLWQASRLPS